MSPPSIYYVIEWGTVAIVLSLIPLIWLTFFLTRYLTWRRAVTAWKQLGLVIAILIVFAVSVNTFAEFRWGSW